MAAAETQPDGRAAAVDYLAAPFSMARVLEWGSRPVWSPDGKRIAFTEHDLSDTQGYELDLASRTVRCLTCHLGMDGLITRIFYLPGGSYLIIGPRGLGRGQPYTRTINRSSSRDKELYWLPAGPEATLQPLGEPAFGDIAIARQAEPGGGVRIAWGTVDDKGSALHTAVLSVAGGAVRLDGRRTLYESGKAANPPGMTVSESYDIVAGGRAVSFYTIVARDGTLNGDMVQVDTQTGRISTLYADAAHNEVHLFPDERFGLEESNRASDPAGAWRGVSSHGHATLALIGRLAGMAVPGAEAMEDYAPYRLHKGLDRPFDLFVVRPGGREQPRQLTDMGRLGANAHQSAPAPDGRRIVFAVDPRESREMRGKGGLYIGAFGE